MHRTERLKQRYSIAGVTAHTPQEGYYVNFAFTEEQDQLRDFVRSFLEEKSSEEEVRRLMDTDDGYDAAVWSQMAEQR